VAGEFLMRFAIAHELFGGHITIEDRHEILSGYPVPGLIEESGYVFFSAPPEKSIQNHHFWNGVVRTTGVTANTFSCPGCRKKYNGITAKLNIELQGVTLLVG
jgi:hypothetical protein